MKTCLDCGDTIKGRSDKKFCNDQCRNNYNNKLNTDASSQVRSINAVLRKNRRILEELIPVEGKGVVAKKKLTDKGFNPDYHTHTYITQKGDTYKFCYEYGYLSLEAEKWMLVKRDAN